MEEETTTGAPVDNGGVQTINGVAVDEQGQAISQPEETEQAPAVSTETTEQPEPQSQETVEQSTEQVTNEPSDDEQLETFAKNKGLTLDSENAVKAAKMAMNAERLMHQKAQRTSELEKATTITADQVPADATPQDRENYRLRNLELRTEISEWKLANQDKLQYEPTMVEVLSDPIKRSLVQEGYLSLDDVFVMAKGKSPVNEADLKSQGKKEALQSLAQKQQAAVPRGNAVNSVTQTETITPQNVDSLVAKNDLNWFRTHQEEINRAMAGGF